MIQILLKAAAFIFTFITVFSRHLTTTVNGEILTPHNLLPDVAINCGCLSNSTALDGRHWVGETPLLQPKGKSRAVTSASNSFTADPTPFLTARISSTHFSYSFQVNPGQKFVRLHFCPASYGGFQNSRDFFTVKANSFTLLQNYSASLAADALGLKYIVKEFCLNVNETGNIQINFFASQKSRKKIKNHAFVNGIEIISMPTGLYYTPDGSLGPPIVGHTDNFYNVDNSTALELIHRLNVGGGSILPVEDTGMFRRWSEDANYLLGSFGFQQINYLMPAIEHVVTSPFIAPIKVYQTSRVFKTRLKSGEEHDFTTKIPVDLGFCYLLRLHFCYCRGEDAEGSPEDFSILIQNVVAETQVNVVQLSGGNGIPVYRDYLVMMKGDKAEGKHDLLISLQSVDELVLGILKGLEIFKLSNPDNSLASPNPSCSKFNSLFLSLKIRNVLVGFGRLNVVMTALIILLAMVNAAVYQVRQICEYKFWHDRVESAPKEPSCCHFSLAEILSATGNFNEALVIGTGGFGKVYKGIVYGRPEVLAIKRLKSSSKQGAHEFWREIETLSKLRHIHLVPLIGYCNESQEMILVYEYMPRGTIADNIYRAPRNGKERISLTWEQRLRICIGAARGIDYLHTGSQYGVIHRDVKDTNILLDENFVAKISDFGLSKEGTIAESQGQVTTKVKGTPGYLDPHYLVTHKPSISSDIYAFGIVMLVVLSGRPAVEIKLFPEEHESLLACFRECMTKGEMKEIIDPSIQGDISAESLTKFTEAVENCLHHLPKKRPTMAQVVVFLEHALGKHQASVHFALTDETVDGQPYPDGSNQPFELQVAPIPEESVASISAEGKEIQNADLHSKVVVLQPKEKDRNITQKALWGRPWFSLKNIRKPTKRKGMSLPTYHSLPLQQQQSLSPKRTYDFSLKEIISATQNFSSKCLIGKGGFGDMYKGVGNGGSRIVAIKRLKNYGAKEFQAEVELLSMLHYIHVVSLVGFCNERNELFLVYEYMARGSLANHIYRTSGNNISLSWEQRIRICIGAARGLNYLHEIGVIHRDVNDHNIMLDENFVPKIYTIALSKLVNASPSQTHFSTVVAGTYGYLDPHYFLTSQLVKASDVYSFGIVLLVFLRGRPAVDHTLPEEDQHLKLWFETCFQNGDLDKIVDRTMEGRIPKASFGKFVHLTQNSLHEDPKHRPVMTRVVANLEEVLDLAQEDPKHRPVMTRVVANLEEVVANLEEVLDLAQEMPSLTQEFNRTDNIESSPALSTPL